MPMGNDGRTLLDIGLEMLPSGSSPITWGLIMLGRIVDEEVIGEEGDGNVGDPLKIDTGVLGCN